MGHREETYPGALEAHYESVWGAPVAAAGSRWKLGRAHELPADFRVRCYRRSPGMLAYATVCMSQPSDAERLELHMLVAEEEPEAAEPVTEVLAAVAHYHRTGHALGLGHTVNFGRPWLPRSRCTFGLISLPYLDGPGLERLATPEALEAPEVRFLWLIPITPEEREFKVSGGLEALEQVFDAAPVSYWDPRRASLC